MTKSGARGLLFCQARGPRFPQASLAQDAPSWTGPGAKRVPVSPGDQPTLAGRGKRSLRAWQGKRRWRKQEDLHKGPMRRGCFFGDAPPHRFPAQSVSAKVQATDGHRKLPFQWSRLPLPAEPLKPLCGLRMGGSQQAAEDAPASIEQQATCVNSMLGF